MPYRYYYIDYPMVTYDHAVFSQTPLACTDNANFPFWYKRDIVKSTAPAI